MIYRGFNKDQLEKTLAEWLHNRGRPLADPGQGIAALIREYLYSNESRQAGLINGEERPS